MSGGPGRGARGRRWRRRRVSPRPASPPPAAGRSGARLKKRINARWRFGEEERPTGREPVRQPEGFGGEARGVCVWVSLPPRGSVPEWRRLWCPSGVSQCQTGSGGSDRHLRRALVGGGRPLYFLPRGEEGVSPAEHPPPGLRPPPGKEPLGERGLGRARRPASDRRCVEESRCKKNVGKPVVCRRGVLQ